MYTELLRPLRAFTSDLSMIRSRWPLPVRDLEEVHGHLWHAEIKELAVAKFHNIWIHSSPLVRSMFCPTEIDHIRGLTL